jgi:hypothetical protein
VLNRSINFKIFSVLTFGLVTLEAIVGVIFVDEDNEIVVIGVAEDGPVERIELNAEDGPVERIELSAEDAVGFAPDAVGFDIDIGPILGTEVAEKIIIVVGDDTVAPPLCFFFWVFTLISREPIDYFIVYNNATTPFIFRLVYSS